MYVNTHTYKYVCLKKMNLDIRKDPHPKQIEKTYNTYIDSLSFVGPIYIYIWSLDSYRFFSLLFITVS